MPTVSAPAHRRRAAPALRGGLRPVPHRRARLRPWRRALAIAAALRAGGVAAAPRSAPRPASQRAQLESGTAILQLSEGQPALAHEAPPGSLDGPDAAVLRGAADGGGARLRRGPASRGAPAGRGGRPPRPPAELRALPGHPARVRGPARGDGGGGLRRPRGERGRGGQRSVRAHPDLERPHGRELRGDRRRCAGVSAPGQHLRHRRERPRHPRGRHRGRRRHRVRRLSPRHRARRRCGGLLGGRGAEHPLRGRRLRPHPRPPRAGGRGGQLVLRGVGRRALRLRRPHQPGHQAPARRRDHGGVLERQLGFELRGGQPSGRLRLLARRRPTAGARPTPTRLPRG